MASFAFCAISFADSRILNTNPARYVRSAQGTMDIKKRPLRIYNENIIKLHSCKGNEMPITIDITISELINKISATSNDQEESLLQIFDKFMVELNKLPKEKYEEIWQAIMDVRVANDKLLEIHKRNCLLDPQMPKCESCRAGLLYITNQELRKKQKQLDTIVESI